ncbi:unnamed protein product [Pelagomonas calceolata]|uniref:Uncharacterized protein n=1 Tax=Pelagomonas calceolata TaxID=35677 RepID=A0A8J2SGJ8_9STRA|nr:unnamed protein product [Pelagomonas calceolata]
MGVFRNEVNLGMNGYVVRKRTRLGDTENEQEAATDRRVTENHYPSDDNPYDSLYPVDDRGKTKELDPESQEVSAKEMFDSTVMAFPWLPFFSNCRGFDSQVAYSKLLETHEDCRLSKHEDTRFIYDFDPLEQLLTKGMWESDAVADICVHDRALAAS